MSGALLALGILAIFYALFVINEQRLEDGQAATPVAGGDDGECWIYVDNEHHKTVHGYKAFKEEMDDLIDIKGVDPSRIRAFNPHPLC